MIVIVILQIGPHEGPCKGLGVKHDRTSCCLQPPIPWDPLTPNLPTNIIPTNIA